MQSKMSKKQKTLPNFFEFEKKLTEYNSKAKHEGDDEQTPTEMSVLPKKSVDKTAEFSHGSQPQPGGPSLLTAEGLLPSLRESGILADL